jgi:chromosome segregation ATPase
LQKQLRELKEGRREMEEEANKLTREIHDLTERSGRVRAEVAEPTLVLPSLGQMWAG